jgi:hypothetical protein
MMDRLTCSRCARPAPFVIDADDEGGDPDLPRVVVPPEGSDWIGDPDGDGLICCATPDEIAAWMEGLELVGLEMQFADVDDAPPS